MTYVSEMRGLVGHRPLLLAAAGVVVVDEAGRWLLQRRVDDSLWGLIGGALELGESFGDAARRELFEESGLTAGSLRQLDVYSGPEFRHTYPNGDQTYVVGVTFLADHLAGTAAPDGQEGSELRWFSPDEFPVLSGYNALLATRAQASLAELGKRRGTPGSGTGPCRPPDRGGRRRPS
jgi:8-oxo-dGTP diphosphatase